MEIQYIGKYSLILKGKKEQILIDPNGSLDSFGGRVVLSTFGVWSMPKMKPDQVLISGPGEYEVGGVEIVGVSAGNDQSVFLVTFDGLTVCFLGGIKEELTEKRVDRIDSADVLVVPCGKSHKELRKTFLQWAKKWGVNYIIPIGYEADDELTEFLDLMDAEGLKPIDSLKITREELPEGMEVIVLNKHE